MRIALFIDEEDVNAIRAHLENKYNGEVTMTQIEAYIDSLVQDKVKEIGDGKSKSLFYKGNFIRKGC